MHLSYITRKCRVNLSNSSIISKIFQSIRRYGNSIDLSTVAKKILGRSIDHYEQDCVILSLVVKLVLILYNLRWSYQSIQSISICEDCIDTPVVAKIVLICQWLQRWSCFDLLVITKNIVSIYCLLLSLYRFYITCKDRTCLISLQMWPCPFNILYEYRILIFQYPTTNWFLGSEQILMYYN